MEGCGGGEGTLLGEYNKYPSVKHGKLENDNLFKLDETYKVE